MTFQKVKFYFTCSRTLSIVSSWYLVLCFSENINNHCALKKILKVYFLSFLVKSETCFFFIQYCIFNFNYQLLLVYHFSSVQIKEAFLRFFFKEKISERKKKYFTYLPTQAQFAWVGKGKQTIFYFWPKL